MRARVAPRGFAGAISRAALLAAALSLAVASCGCGVENRQAGAARVGYVGNDLHQVAYHIAKEKGFFTEQGVEVREEGAFGSGPEVMGALSAGGLDFGYAGASTVLTFAGREMADVRIVAQVDAGGSAIVVRNGLEVQDVAGLKGRTVAVPGYATVQDFLLRTAMKRAGLADGDVNVKVTRPAEMPGELESGRVDAAVACEPCPTIVIARNAGRLLETSEEILPGHPCCLLFVDAGFLRRDPAAVRAIVEAHAKATRYAADNRTEAADIAHLFAGQPTEIAREAVRRMTFSFRPDTKTLARYAEFLASSGVIKTEDPAAFAKGLLDTSFLPEDGG